MRDRYLELIDRIVDLTLQGKIRSKVQVYKLLVEGIEPGTGEVFEGCLSDRIAATEAQLEIKVKAARILRALQTLRGEWERYAKENQAQDAIATATQQILSAEPDERLLKILQALDPNQKEAFGLDRVQKLARSLQQVAQIHPDPHLAAEIKQLAAGILSGLQSFTALEDYLIRWIYDQGESNLGFGKTEEQRGPWALWAKHSPSPFLGQLFTTLAQNQPVAEMSRNTGRIEDRTWLELAVALQFIRQGLVSWFDQQPYDTKIGKQLSTSTLLTFAGIWSQLANGFQGTGRSHLVDGSFQVSLQILRTFANREDFPLYGGVFASFGGKQLRNTLEYLDEPLGRFEATPEKARILTLLGYSQRALGQYQQAITFHEQALEIARNVGDKECEIANLNHLSRIQVSQKNYREAISTSQRALILARQEGDRAGEANALVNLGYSEVFSARQLDRMETEAYEGAMNYLEEGLEIAQKLGDRQSQALAYNSLGIAYAILEKPQQALKFLADGLKAAQSSGDLYLQGLNYAYIAEAYYSNSDLEKAVVSAALGMYLLEQIGATEWRQPAGLLLVLQGKAGEEAVRVTLNQHRSEIIAAIGVDGYDRILQVLEENQRSP